MRGVVRGVSYLINLISGTPTILPRDSEDAELAAGAGRDTGAGIKFDRVVAIHRQSNGQARARIRLLVISSDAIQGGTAARKVGPSSDTQAPDLKL